MTVRNDERFVVDSSGGEWAIMVAWIINTEWIILLRNIVVNIMNPLCREFDPYDSWYTIMH